MAKSQVRKLTPKHFHVLLTLLALTGVQACIPMNTEFASTTTTDDATDIATSIATSSSDGAQGQCALLDINHPDRRLCKSCYQTLLSQRCPSVTSSCSTFSSNPAACCSASVASQFTTLVNQCVLNSRVAGFTCATTCAAGLTLNSRTCTCESTSSTTTPIVGESGSAYINVGNTDYGPPVVSLSFDTSSAAVTVSEEALQPALTQCGYPMSSSPPFWMSIRNRGNTIFQYNTYLSPVLSSATNSSGAALITGATPPQAGTGPLGANIFTKIGLQTAGLEEFSRYTGLAGEDYPRNMGGLGGSLGKVHLLSGRPEYTLPVTMTEDDLTTPNPDLVIPVPPTPGPEVQSPAIGASDEVGLSRGNGEPASSATWAYPGHGTVDRWGNVYFFDGKYITSADSSLRVICNDVRVSATNHWCSGLTRGEVYPILGVVNNWTATTQTRGVCDWHAGIACSAQTAAAGTTARLSGNPGGIAIDRFGNIFFVDKGDAAYGPGVGVACAGTSGYCATQAINRVVAVFPTVDTGTTRNRAASTLAASIISRPASIDIETSGNNVNFFIGENTGNIRAYCMFNSSQGPCASYPTSTLPAPTVGNTPPAVHYVYNAATPFAAGNRVITLNYTSTMPFIFNQISDIKINYYGNVFYTERNRHRINAICYNPNTGDLCAGKSGTYRLAGSGTPGTVISKRGSTYDGTPLTSPTLLTFPTALAIRKPFADYTLVNEYGAPHKILPPAAGPTSLNWDRLADHNLVYTEGFSIGPNQTLTGNKLGVLCGNNAKVAQGVCEGLKANVLYQLSGRNGVSREVAETKFEKLAQGSCGGYNTEPYDELFPFVPKPAASFTYNGIAGVTYDGLGNLVVSSQSSYQARDASLVQADSLECDDPTVVRYNRDNAIYLIQLTKTGTNTAGIKFGFRDSNNLVAYYCLRVTAKSSCMRFDGNATCTCQPTQATGSLGFWLSSTATAACP